MTKYREIIRLTGMGFSQRDIIAQEYSMTTHAMHVKNRRGFPPVENKRFIMN